MRKIDHIGIAVRSLEQAIPFYTESMKLEYVETEVVPTEKVRVAVLMSGDLRVELLEPTSPDSTIAQYIDKRGPGVHHMAYAVDDVEHEVKLLLENNAQLIQPAPRPGAGGCKVAFLHPKATGGVLIELVERPRSHR